jgi:hypothetical protein
MKILTSELAELLDPVISFIAWTFFINELIQFVFNQIRRSNEIHCEVSVLPTVILPYREWPVFPSVTTINHTKFGGEITHISQLGKEATGLRNILTLKLYLISYETL